MFQSPLQSDTASRPSLYSIDEHSSTAIARALDLIAPYCDAPDPTLPAYPGRRAIWREVLPGASLSAVYAWRSGRRTMPQWARDMLANHLRRHALEQLRIADELTKEKGT